MTAPTKRTDRAVLQSYPLRGHLEIQTSGHDVLLSGRTDGINANGLGFYAKIVSGDMPVVSSLPGNEIDMLIDFFAPHSIAGEVVWGKGIEGQSDYDLFLGVRFRQIPCELRDKIMVLVSDDVKKRAEMGMIQSTGVAVSNDGGSSAANPGDCSS